ncbi:MAG: MBL fold metallo-hydrolase [Cyanobacteria bacterium P01_A01_bin.135]
MHLIYYGANSWLWDLNGYRILVDPWLVDSLVFPNLSWLFKGDHTEPVPMPEQIDLILLSQGLPDHTHKPTLQQLDRSIPVVGSPNAAKTARALNYSSVTAIAPGEIYRGDRLEIAAFQGAPVGVTPENGYWVTVLPNPDTSSSASPEPDPRPNAKPMTLYYEPHGFPPGDIATRGPVDIVISPIVNLELPLAGAIIQGEKTALQLAEALTPQLFLPTAAGGDNITYSGVLDAVLSTSGSAESLRRSLAAQQISTTVVEPLPYRPVAV